jgi:hypothetical protein
MHVCMYICLIDLIARVYYLWCRLLHRSALLYLRRPPLKSDKSPRYMYLLFGYADPDIPVYGNILKKNLSKPNNTRVCDTKKIVPMC